MAKATLGHPAGTGCLGTTVSFTEGETSLPYIFLSSENTQHIFSLLSQHIFFISEAKARLPPFLFMLPSSYHDPSIPGPEWVLV